MSKAVILVTGGTGLVGRGIQHIIESEPANSRFGKRDGETWIFASSSEGDLRCVNLTPVSLLLEACVSLSVWTRVVSLSGSKRMDAVIQRRPRSYLRNISRHMLFILLRSVCHTSMLFILLRMILIDVHVRSPSRWPLQEHEIQGTYSLVPMIYLSSSKGLCNMPH